MIDVSFSFESEREDRFLKTLEETGAGPGTCTVCMSC